MDGQRRERKVVTVLFADLVGFTARAEELDPEDVEAILRPYHERLRSELERFGGRVEKFIGDAVMALFGAPIAHEDDPERAVRAALAIRDWAREAGEVQVRIQVAQGLHLEMTHQLSNALHAVDHRRDDDHRPRFGGDTIEIEPRQAAGRDQIADHTLQQLNGHFARWHGDQCRDRDQRRAPPAVRPGVEDGQILCDVLPQTSLPVWVFFDLGNNEHLVQARQGEVLYAGGVPGSVAGLLQIKVRIPSNVVDTGDAVPFFLMIGSHWTVYQVTVALR